LVTGEQNWGIIGNTRAVRALAAEVAAGSTVRSYIFAGPERVGKAAAAMRLAQALNCIGGEPPCGECDACTRIAQGKHADVMTISIDTEAEGPARKAISVKQVRDVEVSVALAPYQGKMRVVIFDPAETMSADAQNAFLKTLEEPPPHAVFVLVTTDAGLLLETVRSRCRLIEFGLVAAGEIEAALRERGVEAERAELLSRLAVGRPGWAIEASARPAILEKRSESFDLARELPRMSVSDRIDLAENLSDRFKRDRAPVDDTLEDWLGYWRDVMLVQSGAEDAIANVDRRDEIAAAADEYGRAHVTSFVEALRDTRQHLRENVQSRIALDALLLNVPRRASLPSRSVS
jgi:DNA polymerase-3 subunit delta'